MEILQSISLDFGKDTEPIIVFAKQGDIDTRYVEITPLNSGKKYMPEAGTTARLHITKPDGKIVLSDAVIDFGTGTIKAELTKQTLTAAGMAVAEIGLYKGEALLTSQLFGIRVSKKAYSDDAVMSSDDYKSLVDALANVDSAVKLAESAAEGANSAKDAANSAAQKATDAAGSVNAAKDAANSAAGKADEAASKASSAADSANAAKQSADEAAQKATASAGKADTSAANADAKAKTAEEKAALANIAAGNANAAADKADKWGNVSVTAKDLAPGSAPTAKLTDTADGKSLEFGIPRGENGLINGVRLNGERLPPDAENVVDVKAYNEDNKPEVGGRNYITGTSDDWIDIPQKTEGIRVPGTKPIYIEDCGLNVGDNILLHGDIFVDGISSGGLSFNQYKKSGDMISRKFRYFGQGTYINAQVNASIIEGCSYFDIMCHRNLDSDTIIKIRKIKLERGEIATDWTPAPEDLAPTADNFEGVLPVEKGGTGNGLGRVKDISKYAENNTTIGLAYKGNIAEQMSGGMYPVLACDTFETGGCAFGGVNANFFKEKLGIASTISLTPTQLALTSLYESRTISAASSDMPAESPSIDGELSALDQNMIKVYADLCLNPDSGKSVDDVPENLRLYVSTIVEETLAKRKEEEERYKAEMAEREAEERLKAELAERQAEEERGQVSEEIEPEDTDVNVEAVPEPVEETKHEEAENQPDDTPQDSGEKEEEE